MSLTRQQNRAMKRHTAAVDQACEGDRKFFERHRDRSNRLRLASKAETAQMVIAGDTSAQGLDADTVLFVLVRQLAPGVRLRAYAPGPAHEAGEDYSEHVAATLWAELRRRRPSLQVQETMMIEAMRRPGGPLHDAGVK